jgi:hypothetical protein
MTFTSMARLVASVMSSTLDQPAAGSSSRYPCMTPKPMTPTGIANCMTFETVFAAVGLDQRTDREMLPSMAPGTHHLQSSGANWLFSRSSVSVLTARPPVTIPSTVQS